LRQQNLSQKNFKKFKIFGKICKLVKNVKLSILRLRKPKLNFISKTKQIPGQRGKTTHQAVTESPLPDALI
jgi:hypothetical protein